MSRRWTKHSPIVAANSSAPIFPVFGQPFGKLGETGDVDEDDSPVDDAVAKLGRVLDPVDDEPRHIRRKEVVILDGARMRGHARPISPCSAA